MSITYRLAQYADLGAVESMLRYYLQEQWTSGDPIVPSNRSVQVFQDLARSYINGSGFGVVVLAHEPGQEAPVGFVLAGEHPGATVFDTVLGKVAVIWIAWTHPAHRKAGLGLGMLSFVRPHLVGMGFLTATMTVRDGNEMGNAISLAFGAKPTERVYFYTLPEEPAHLGGNARG